MKIRDEASAEEVREFYQSDMARRVRARTHGNLRIDRASDFLLTRVKQDSRILDMGCGIGIASERMAKKADKGHVFALDISPAHIDYCTRTIDLPNITFALVDVLEEFDKALDLIQEPVDMITMVDVIEHLPLERSRAFFKKLPELLQPNGRILLTYPSPEYQRYLYETPNERLQAVDLVLELEDILELADLADCRLRSFAYVDVWRQNQFVHCELAGTIACTGQEKPSHTPIDLVRKGLKKLTRPVLKHKYIKVPLKERTPQAD